MCNLCKARYVISRSLSTISFTFLLLSLTNREKQIFPFIQLWTGRNYTRDHWHKSAQANYMQGCSPRWNGTVIPPQLNWTYSLVLRCKFCGGELCATSRKSWMQCVFKTMEDCSPIRLAVRAYNRKKDRDKRFKDILLHTHILILRISNFFLYYKHLIQFINKCFKSSKGFSMRIHNLQWTSRKLWNFSDEKLKTNYRSDPSNNLTLHLRWFP